MVAYRRNNLVGIENILASFRVEAIWFIVHAYSTTYQKFLASTASIQNRSVLPVVARELCLCLLMCISTRESIRTR
jgi:hypothetical protein